MSTITPIDGPARQRYVSPIYEFDIFGRVNAGLDGSVHFARAEEVAYEFHPQPQDTRTWLTRQGFQFKLDADNASRTRIRLDKAGLEIETLAPAEPLIARSGINVAQPARLIVSWGVNRYPTGANWDVGVNNEPIMVMTSFGTQLLSGGLFVPPSPYFIGFFLCENGRRGVPIAGRSYGAQGRYVCLDGPPTGKEITTVISLDDQFRRAFRTTGVPPVTGFAIEADTTQVNTGGRSSAWIKSITIKSSK